MFLQAVTIRRLPGVSKETLGFGLLNCVKTEKTVRTFEIGICTFCIMICPQICEDQGVESCGLKDNGPQRNIYLNAWPPIGRIT